MLFPFALSPLVIKEDLAVHILDNATQENRLIAFFPELPKANEKVIHAAENMDVPVPSCIINGKCVSAIGSLGRVVKMLKFPDGTMRVLVRGISRIRHLENLAGTKVPMVRIEKISPDTTRDIKNDAMARNAIRQFQEIVSYAANFPEELKVAVLNLNDNTRLVDLIADTINISFQEKLAILILENLQNRLQLLTILLNREVEVLHLGSEIQNQVHSTLSKNQREYFLREQLKQIKEELGESDKNPDLLSIARRMKEINLPETVRNILDKETERLNMIPQASSEYNIAYTYIDWLLSVPWNVYTKDRLDVKEAAAILDADHYGLKDVKERILEFLSVLQLRKSRKAPIICFVGPPGVGKTSLGKSIANAMGRKFVRISLGGIKDEAEIRGHRRTYIGALPGRIIQGMKKAGTSNPVFMLDELDKVGNDYRGDPAAALLEVLDPQQNFAFNDHYLEVDYDLSSVMFIATANLQDTIPGPLLDRMEIIRLPGYTAMEKHQIAKRYLIPRQMKENGLKSDDLLFTRGAVDEMITYYTLEAGVRNLERTIGTVCRKIARKIVEGALIPGSHFLITAEEVRNLLGPRKFIQDEAENLPQIGIATGMAWTSAGGSTLQVEATKMPGKGDLKLTGSLGNVMKESAMTAFSYVRSRSEELNIPSDAFQKYDFHIHVPDGATPKDGPSAGVTLTTALVSLLTGKPVRPHLSMTGEITLRGKVTPVGGIKEKVIAALRSGIRDIIMPAENSKDLEEVPDEIKSRIRFHFVSDIQEVLDIALASDYQDTPVHPEEKPEDPNEVYSFTIPEDPPESADEASSPEKHIAETEQPLPSAQKSESSAISDSIKKEFEEAFRHEIQKQLNTADPDVVKAITDLLQADDPALPAGKKDTAEKEQSAQEPPLSSRDSKSGPAKEPEKTQKKRSLSVKTLEKNSSASSNKKEGSLSGSSSGTVQQTGSADSSVSKSARTQKKASGTASTAKEKKVSSASSTRKNKTAEKSSSPSSGKTSKAASGHKGPSGRKKKEE